MKKLFTNNNLKKIERTIEQKTKKVKPFNELIESKQLYYDELLKIYVDAFTTLIRYSITYSTLLSQIKIAFENALQVRDERISQLLIQDRVFGISAKRTEIEDKLKTLSNENDELKNTNWKLTLEILTLKKDLAKLKDDKFTDYLTLMEERDARYTLYHENMALEAKVRILTDAEEGAGRAAGRGEPVLLRIALDRCREQLTAAQRELNRMTDDYAETVPRRLHDALENEHCELNKKLDAVRTEYEALQNSYRRVVAQKKSLAEEVEEIKERCRELERAGTPRPQWEICADFIGGGWDRWCQLARGLPSKDILMVLLKELGPAAETEHLEYFEGLGTDPAVPPYLRYEGRVRNLRLSRREVSVIVNDIWRSKLRHAPDLPMQDYVTKYFEDRYQQASVRAEWAYNVCAGVERQPDEPQVQLLRGALLGGGGGGAGAGAGCERAYRVHRDACRALRDRLYRHAADGETVTIEEFQKIAKATFPLKSEVDLKNLLDVVRKQLKLKINQNLINLDKLFMEEPEFVRSQNEEGVDRLDFARELYRQQQLAQDKYVRELVAELGGRRASNKMITVDRLKQAFAVVDPAIDHIRMERYVRCAFGEQDAGGGGGAGASPLRAVAARLAAACVQRVGPRHKAFTRRTLY